MYTYKLTEHKSTKQKWWKYHTQNFMENTQHGKWQNKNTRSLNGRMAKEQHSI